MSTSTVKRGAKKRWYDYLWAASLAYLILGFFNIMFAWLGLICFVVPLLISIVTGSKVYCNKYCGRGQLFTVLGKKLRLSGSRPVPRWLKSKWFRYGFLAFFMVMFCQMLFNTWLVFSGSADLREAVTLLWTFRLPWHHAYHSSGLPLWTAQFAFGFYSVMLTSTILGLITMVLFRPRSWCVYCPMGTMTQLICQAKAGAACSAPRCGSCSSTPDLTGTSGCGSAPDLACTSGPNSCSAPPCASGSSAPDLTCTSGPNSCSASPCASCSSAPDLPGSPGPNPLCTSGSPGDDHSGAS